MNERIRELALEARLGPALLLHHWGKVDALTDSEQEALAQIEKFAELIVQECINREQLLGAIARGWCSEKNSHKTMDSDLALAIFDEVERQIKQQVGVE